MSDLATQIAALQDQFQRIADRHDWICLSTPPPGRGPAFAGEAFDRGPFRQVREPVAPARLAVADFVNVLTDQAGALLLLALEGQSQIPEDVVEEIRAWERAGPGRGWIRWLRFAWVNREVLRVQHYPQAAVAALRFLKGATQRLAQPPANRGQQTQRRRPPRKNADRDAWVARQRGKKKPPPWDEIYDDATRLAAKKGWDMPKSAKALAEAYYRCEKQQRNAAKT
jgi:hypothetical protein